jgi:hypothetical protein
MTQASWPSPSHGTPARAVTDAEYPHLAPWASDGIFQSATDVVYANSSGREIHVRAEKYGLVQGHAWYSGSAEFALTIGANASGSTRTDTAVLRLDRSTWDVTIEVRAGTPGSGAPTLVRDAGDTGLWEIPVADVTVDNGVSVIASGKVTPRPLLQSGAVRACSLITDIQPALATGDIVYETSTGRWLVWTSSGAVPFVGETPWITFPYASGFASAGGSPGYGLVYVGSSTRLKLRGQIKKSSGASFSLNAGVTIGTLPGGYSPAATRFVPIATQYTTASAARLNINTNGTLVAQGPQSVEWLSLDGIELPL